MGCAARRLQQLLEGSAHRRRVAAARRRLPSGGGEALVLGRENEVLRSQEKGIRQRRNRAGCRTRQEAAAQRGGLATHWGGSVTWAWRGGGLSDPSDAVARGHHQGGKPRPLALASPHPTSRESRRARPHALRCSDLEISAAE